MTISYATNGTEANNCLLAGKQIRTMFIRPAAVFARWFETWRLACYVRAIHRHKKLDSTVLALCIII